MHFNPQADIRMHYRNVEKIILGILMVVAACAMAFPARTMLPMLSALSPPLPSRLTGTGRMMAKEPYRLVVLGWGGRYGAPDLAVMGEAVMATVGGITI